jgi:hypothetical protein
MVMVGTWYRKVYNNVMDHQFTTCKVMEIGVILHQNTCNEHATRITTNNANEQQLKRKGEWFMWVFGNVTNTNNVMNEQE